MASSTAFLEVSFGVSQICPSATAVNAPGSKITPETVLGNEGLLTRFKITAATATWPMYGSPLDSPLTALASNRMSFCEKPFGMFDAVVLVPVDLAAGDLGA